MLNHIVLQGRLVRDPELRHTQSGVAVCSFSLAVERDASSSDGKRKADFIDCVAWRGSGEFVNKYFHKGSAAIVSGRLELRDWTDKDGGKRRSATVNVGSVYFGESKKSTACNTDVEDESATIDGTANFYELPDIGESDLPF